MNRKLVALFVVCIMIITGTGCKRTNNLNNEKNMENLNLTAEWDKTFPKSDKVIHSKVIFTNRYGITLAADMYVPKNITGKLPANAPQFFKDYHAYYKTPRGYHKRSLNSNQGRNATEAIPFINFPLMSRADEIENAVLIIHGEKAHSRYFGEDAFKKLKGDNKELMIIPGASHTDLYDNLAVIPFDRMEAFFQKNLK